MEIQDQHDLGFIRASKYCSGNGSKTGWNTESNQPQRHNPTREADLFRAWKRRNADALCALVTSSSDSVLTLIQHTNKASEAWNILKGQYETRNQTRIQNLEDMLAVERCSDGESAETFITRIKNLCDQMAAVGITKTSEELARRYIRILPQKYDALVTTLNTQVRNPPLHF